MCGNGVGRANGLELRTLCQNWGGGKDTLDLRGR